MESAENKKHYEAAMNTAVRLLSMRNHTEYEIKQKLGKRSFPHEVIDAVICECKRLNYINDDESAKIYFRELKNKGFGPRRIIMEMKKKGLNHEHIENVISEYGSQNEEIDTARKILEKNISKFNREKDGRKRREKIYRFLFSRGFSGSVISELIRESDLQG